ncbi:MAG: ATP-binding cassette domain-containing protein [Bacteroides sp.]|nr:ATP-binding cassette domain-containing protein [Bacteroides sp.]
MFELNPRNPDIRIRDLNIRVKGNHILKDVNLDIPDKKITCIIGPSGCGKTTLLKSVNRLLDVNEGYKVSGSVQVDGEDIYHPKTEITHIRKKIGLLSQRSYTTAHVYF